MKWKLVKKKLSEVKPYSKNPRQMTKKGMEDLHKSSDKFGLAEPIVINTDGVVIGGHARLLALKEKGTKEFDCYIPDRKLTEKELQELNVRLNKNIAGEFDFDILANEFEFEDLLEWGFDKIELGMVDEVAFPALKDGDKEPFQQMTFTLADEQATIIQNKLADIKKTEEYKYVETYGNENSNGNALYLLVCQK